MGEILNVTGTNPRADFQTGDFDFELPPENIATEPARPRESAKLLEVGETLVDHTVADLPSLLTPGDVVVINDTRVIPARLRGTRRGAKVQVTLHKAEADGKYTAAGAFRHVSRVRRTGRRHRGTTTSLLPPHPWPRPGP